MKRSDMLILIANQIDFLNNAFNGFRVDYSPNELKRADVILTSIEEAGMIPPNLCDSGNCKDIGCGNQWEEEAT